MKITSLALDHPRVAVFPAFQYRFKRLSVKVLRTDLSCILGGLKPPPADNDNARAV